MASSKTAIKGEKAGMIIIDELADSKTVDKALEGYTGGETRTTTSGSSTPSPDSEADQLAQDSETPPDEGEAGGGPPVERLSTSSPTEADLARMAISDRPTTPTFERTVVYTKSPAEWRQEIRLDDEVTYLDKARKLQRGMVTAKGIAVVAVMDESSDLRPHEVHVDDVLVIHR
jgi:hypothetical protein